MCRLGEVEALDVAQIKAELHFVCEAVNGASVHVSSLDLGAATTVQRE